MAVVTTAPPAVPVVVPAPASPRLVGTAAMLTGATSTQVGAALGAHAFAAIGPVGVVAVRQVVAALVLLPVARPRWRSLTWAQWWPALALGVVFVGMNLGLYTAIDRVGLGLAVTLEFLGPLAVAVASSRRLLDLLAALVAAGGVYLLVLPGPSTDLVGIGAGVLAAACWAAYILLNRAVGRRLPGLQAPAVAATVASLLCLPVLAWIWTAGLVTPAALGYAVAAGVLSSAVPYAADLIALRHVAPGSFGLFMSAHPVLAAVAGLVLLQQALHVHEWVGILVVVAANVLSVARSIVRPSTTRSTTTGPGEGPCSSRSSGGRAHRTAPTRAASSRSGCSA